MRRLTRGWAESSYGLINIIAIFTAENSAKNHCSGIDPLRPNSTNLHGARQVELLEFHSLLNCNDLVPQYFFIGWG